MKDLKHQIKLIKLRRQYFSLFYKWWNDLDLRRLTSGETNFLSTEKINQSLDSHLASPWGFDFIIIFGHKPVGHLLIQKKKNKKYFEIYIAIGEKKYWGRGIGTVAMQKACDWFFRKFSREPAIDLEVLPKNKRAIRCYEKIGFKKIKIKRYKKFPTTILMRLLR